MTANSGEALGIEAARRLVRWGHGRCEIGPGLTGAEFARVEAEFGFEFAADHRAFLAAGLPVGDRWPDWRDGDPVGLRERLDWPKEGVLFDVENNDFWRGDWGTRPSGLEQALEVAREYLATVPTLVPVYSHRYLPAGRASFGHPVLSVYQTDIIYYGLDLADYIDREFGPSGPGGAGWDPRATVEFWRDFV